MVCYDHADPFWCGSLFEELLMTHVLCNGNEEKKLIRQYFPIPANHRTNDADAYWSASCRMLAFFQISGCLLWFCTNLSL
jgi:hypothetical protein